MAAQENHDGVVKFLLANGANQSLATEVSINFILLEIVHSILISYISLFLITICNYFSNIAVNRMWFIAN